jgi:hypothetical protein
MQKAIRPFNTYWTSTPFSSAGKYSASGKFSIILFLLFSLAGKISAQTGTISGTIRDSLNKPLYGVTVSVYGKPLGTTSDENGNYSLTVPSGQDL